MRHQKQSAAACCLSSDFVHPDPRHDHGCGRSDVRFLYVHCRLFTALAAGDRNNGAREELEPTAKFAVRTPLGSPRHYPDGSQRSS
jgi:hypothetical protein